MRASIFSFIMSILWFNIYIIIINILRKNNNFIISFSIFPLVFFSALSILRLLLSFDFPSAIIIQSGKLLALIYKVLNIKLFFNISISHLLLVVWVIGFLLLLIKTLFFDINYHRYLKLIPKIESKNYNKVLDNLLIEKQITRHFRLFQSDKIDSPMLFGWRSPTIYLPNLNFTDNEIRYILSHELSHHTNLDYFKKHFIHLLKIIFWWNPFIHVFDNDFSQILEVDCDLKTVKNYMKEEKIEYLKTISKIIEHSIVKNKICSFSSNTSFLVMDNDADKINQRYKIVLEYNKNKRTYKYFNLIVCILAIVLFASSYFIVIQPSYLPDNCDGLYEDNSESNFILKNDSNEYDVYTDNKYHYSLKNLNKFDLDGFIVYE